MFIYCSCRLQCEMSSSHTCRSSRASYQQTMSMIKFMEANPDLNNGKIKDPIIKRSLWDKLAKELNSYEFGATKTATQWRKAWTDKRCQLKAKVWAIKTEQEKRGTKSLKLSLSKLDSMILNLSEPGGDSSQTEVEDVNSPVEPEENNSSKEEEKESAVCNSSLGKITEFTKDNSIGGIVIKMEPSTPTYGDSDNDQSINEPSMLIHANDEEKKSINETSTSVYADNEEIKSIDKPSAPTNEEGKLGPEISQDTAQKVNSQFKNFNSSENENSASSPPHKCSRYCYTRKYMPVTTVSDVPEKKSCIERLVDAAEKQQIALEKQQAAIDTLARESVKQTQLLQNLFDLLYCNMIT